MNKTCSRCGIEKARSEFPKNSANKDGLFGYCIVCRRKQQKEYRATHKHIMRKHYKKWEKIFLDSWKIVIPSCVKCEVCEEDIFFDAKDTSKSIHFDHRHGGREAIKSPKQWLMKHPMNDKNLAIWESCDFGMLCGQCNRHLPTENRERFVKNVTRYFYGSSVIYAEKGAGSSKPCDPCSV